VNGVNRRELFKTAGTLGGGIAVSAIAGPLDPNETGQLLAALADPTRNLSEPVIALLERHDDAAQRHTRAVPASVRACRARQQLEVVRRLRPAASRPDWQGRLAVLEAQAARLSGRLAANWRQDPRAAAADYRLALAAAQDAGPHAVTLRAFALGGMAFLETRLGDRRAAVRTVTEAEVAGAASGLRGLRSWLASTAATVHAGVGARRACDRSLGQAEELFTPFRPGDPAWMDFLSRGFLLEDRAACQLRTGQPRQALATLDQAERLLAAHRSGRRAVILGYRAEALVGGGYLTDGCRSAIQALEVAGGVGYQRVVHQIRAFRRSGPLRAYRSAELRELDERLRLVAAQ